MNERRGVGNDKLPSVRRRRSIHCKKYWINIAIMSMLLTRRKQLYPHENKLGVFLVEEYLGEHCGRVAQELYSRGRLTFQQLVESLGRTPSSQELLPRSSLYMNAEHPEAGSSPALSPHEVGKAVAVLSHHGLITTIRAQPHNRSRTRSKHQVLEINFRSILLRLRVPLYTLAVQEFFFPNSIAGSPFGTQPHSDMDSPPDKPTTMPHYWLRTLVRTVAMCGQITMKKLFDLTIQSKEHDHDITGDGKGGESDIDATGNDETHQADIQSISKWCTLLCSHYIIVPVRGVDVVEERHVPKKSAGGKSASVLTEEQRRNPPCHPRQQIPWEQIVQQDGTSSGGNSRGKRKRGGTTSSQSCTVNPENDEIFFTLNIPLLHRFLQDNKCLEYLTTKTPTITDFLVVGELEDGSNDDDVERKASQIYHVIRSVFRAAREKDHSTQGTMTSVLISIQDVMNAQLSPCEQYSASTTSSSISAPPSSSSSEGEDLPYPSTSSLQDVVDVLLLLTSMPSIQLIKWHDVQPATHVPTNESDQNITLNKRFRLHNRAIVRRVQLDTVEDYVFERFGEMSYRIFRMLMDKGHLDQKSISEEALVPLRTVRICLAKMTKDGLVHVQEVAKRSDRTPQNTWFFWGVRLEKTYTTIIEFIYRSIYNLVLRRARGVDENEDMVRRYETSGGVNFLPPVSYTRY
jgi:hypothetical protein